MRITNVLLGCTASLLVLALPATASDRRASNACRTIRVTAPDAPAPPNREATTKPTFSASTILDLMLEVTLAPWLKGQHQLELKVYTPKGHLYQSLPVTINIPAANADDGNRFSSKRTAAATLPVAGTTIVTNSLYGEWRVEAFLDGERETACARPLSFVIEP